MNPGEEQAPAADAAGTRPGTTRSIIFTLGFQAAKTLIQALSLVVTARLIRPDDFGIYAMAMPIYVFALLFQDSGTAQAIVQRKTISKNDLNTVFAINLGVCLSVIVVLALVAPWIGDFYRTEAVTALVWGFCAVTLLNALAATPVALLTRAHRFRYLAISDASSYAIGVMVGIGTAVLAPGYWALFVMPLTTAVLMCVATWAASGWMPGLPRFEREAGEVFRFGAGVFGFNLLNYFSRNMDLVLLGRSATAAGLGAYDRANRLILFPIQQINIPLTRVLLPVLSRAVDDPARYRRVFLLACAGVLLASQPGLVWLAMDGDMIVPAVLGHRWSEAVQIFSWIGVAALWQGFTYSAGWLLVSQGRTGAFWRWGAFNTVVSLTSFACAMPWGAVGFAVAYAVRENLVRLPGLIWLMGRRGPVSIPDILRMLLPFAIACGLCGLVLGARRLLVDGNVFWMMADLCLAYVAYVAGLALSGSGRHQLGALVRTVGQAAAKRGSRAANSAA